MSNFLTPLLGKIQPHRFACYDLETTIDLQKVYLVGFTDGERYHYHESIPAYPEDKQGAVDAFMTGLTSTQQYNGYWLYAHNAGNFDSLYIVRWLLANSDRFTFEVIPLQSSILMMEVRDNRSYRGNGRVRKWIFLDSYRLMPASLDKLGKAFGLGGKVEDVDYETLHLDPRRYEYLERDCRLLFNCVAKFHVMIQAMGGEVGVTAPSTAMKTFRRKFLKRPLHKGSLDILCGRKPPGMHNLAAMQDSVPTSRHFPECEDEDCPGCLHTFVRAGYYGGDVQVYREEWNGPGLLKLGDFNSMYPAAMLEPLPIEFVRTDNGLHWLNDVSKGLAGFIRCTVEIPADCYLPPLPYRVEGEDKLIFPTGIFTGTWTTVELANVHKVGGRILSIEKAVWFKCEPLLASYVRHFYQYRDKSRRDYDEAFDMVAKLLLNSLYGKFGMNEEREKLWFFPTADEFAEHRLTPMEDAMHGIYTEPVSSPQPYVIPHIAAWVTSIARSRLWQTRNDILQRGGRIWYCDTDSVVTDLDLGSSTALGEIKEVCLIERAVFVAPKLYYLEVYHRMGPHTDDCNDRPCTCGGTKVSEEYVKAKGFGGGFGAPKLTEADFTKLTKHRGKLTTKRMTKLREGLKTGDRFPRMKVVEKGINGTDEKRIHLLDGNTRAHQVVGGKLIGTDGT